MNFLFILTFFNGQVFPQTTKKYTLYNKNNDSCVVVAHYKNYAKFTHDTSISNGILYPLHTNTHARAHTDTVTQIDQQEQVKLTNVQL